MYKRANIGSREKLVLELNLLTPKLCEIKKQVENLKYQIELLDQSNQYGEIKISKHAKQRFKIRFNLQSSLEVKKLIITEDFIKRYKQLGDGSIIHPNIKDCEIVIRDSTIITAIDKYNPIKELTKLNEYMNYYINNMCIPNKMTFNEWKIKYYLRSK